eukprot:CAMPEP_0168426888 /NCGR_PEP_ID=MMETSP0228-20121227/36064_1 /TAXON_ID=133427 /ORGANISM="Protoceratium reticulatum, Strain CCCM 535 (=CCMP 1889)" /LENGTH=110 /DNA_ID=CAMNT_0008440911 /DNA_START=533 /DNA_END=862 /DNA_ORIENTATION=-
MWLSRQCGLVLTVMRRLRGLGVQREELAILMLLALGSSLASRVEAGFEVWQPMRAVQGPVQPGKAREASNPDGELAVGLPPVHGAACNPVHRAEEGAHCRGVQLEHQMLL